MHLAVYTDADVRGGAESVMASFIGEFRRRVHW